MPQTRSKQPAESRLFDMDFSPRLAEGETISSVSSVTQQKVDTSSGARSATSELTLGSASASSQLAQVRIAAGLNGTMYVVTFIVATSLGNTVEAEGYLWVEDT